jgi:PAS domain S-box-containing protein
MPHLVQDPHPSTPAHSRWADSTAATDALDYRRFFEQSLDMLATAGFDGYLKVVNPAFERFLGQTADELTDRPYLDFVHPDDVASTMAEAAKLADGIDCTQFENRHRCSDGTYRWIRWSAKAVVSDELLYCVAFDVTERRAHHDVVDKLVTELQRSNADLGQFAYVASHDLSEPLRMVSSYVQLLAHRYEGKLDADADEFIGYAVDGTARMKALIDDLLAYARAGRVVTLSRPVDCAAVIRDVLTDLGGVVSDGKANVVVGELPVLISDPGLLGQIFQNLVANALKFVKPGIAPEIIVSAEPIDGGWHFSVKDNGIGIAEQHRERIFMMFKRLHGRNEYPGTGIGLALCERVVGRLDGHIWVESEPGLGSTFHFTVPATESTAPGVR